MLSLPLPEAFSQISVCLSDWLTTNIHPGFSLLLRYSHTISTKAAFNYPLLVCGDFEHADNLTNPRLQWLFAFLRCNFFCFCKTQCSCSRCQNVPIIDGAESCCCCTWLIRRTLWKQKQCPSLRRTEALLWILVPVILGSQLFQTFQAGREVIRLKWNIHDHSLLDFINLDIFMNSAGIIFTDISTEITPTYSNTHIIKVSDSI